MPNNKDGLENVPFSVIFYYANLAGFLVSFVTKLN